MKHLSRFLVLVGVLFFQSLASAYRVWDETDELKPCPKLIPDPKVNMNKLGGRWQLSLLVLDASSEDLVQEDACVNGEITVLNTTHFHQVWDMMTPYVENEPTASVELVTRTTKPGKWLLHTPFGTDLDGTVISAGPKHLLVTHCGWQRGNPVHLWTAGITKGRLQPKDRVKLSKALIKAGFHPSETKIITWSNC